MRSRWEQHPVGAVCFAVQEVLRLVKKLAEQSRKETQKEK
jgi:hypothetical protein